MRALSLFRTRLLGAIVAASACAAMAPAAAQAATPGTLDTSFGTNGIASAGGGIRLFGAAAQSDGKVLVTGSAGGTLIVARFTSGGQLDSSFGGGVVHGPAISGALDAGSAGRSVAVQSDGKIVVVGKITSADGTATDGILVERFNSNGSLDGSFGSGGVAKTLTGQLADGYGLAIQSDGKIIATGSADAQGSGGLTPRVAVARFNTNGTADTSFGTGGTRIFDFGAYSVATAVALQKDGKIVIGGSQAPGLQVPNALLARLTTTGAPDPSFGSGGAFAHQYAIGAASSSFNALAIQSDGKIVAAGAATAANNTADGIFVRFTTAGAQDGSFGTGGVTYVQSASNFTVNGAIPGINGVAVAPNGDVVGAGTVNVGGVSSIGLWALRSNGQRDTSFGSGGATLTSAGGTTSAEGNGMAIAPDGKIIVAGDTRAITGIYNSLVARYNGLGAPPPPPPPGLTASLSGVSGSYKTSSVTKSGLKISVTCNQACSLKATLGISAGTAKKLKLKSTITKCTKKHGKKHCVKTKGYKALTIASASKSLSGAGTATFTLRIGRSAANALNKQKSVKVTLKVVATATSTHKTKTITKGLTFKR